MIHQLYRCAFVLLLIALAVLLGAILFFGFPAVVFFVVGLLGIENRVEAILDVIANRAGWVIIASLSLSIALIVGALKYEKHVFGYTSEFLQYWKEAFVNLFRSISTKELLFVLSIPFVASLYFAFTIPVSYDEAITYNSFTIKPFYYCMIFYPYPNNHVLHSLLTNVTEYIPFVSSLFAIRIPAILSSLFAWLIGYSFLKKYYTSRIALLVVGLASVMYMSIFYSFMSRGYAFMVLSFVICMYAAFNIIHKGSRNKDWMFFTVAGVLGCYTIPSFLYPFATLNVLILIYNYKNIKQQIVSNLIAGISVVLLYSPIMIVDGVAALTSNQFVQHIDRVFILNNFHNFYIAMFADIAGVPSFVVALIPIPLFLTIYQKDKWHLSLWIIFILAPFTLLILHAVNPFYRTFLYYNFAIMFLMIVPFKGYLEKIPKRFIILFIVCIQFIGIYSFSTKVSELEGFNTDVAQVVDTYFDEGSSICFPCIASANYEFEAKVRDLEDNIVFLNNEKANVDTINSYDYVILEKWRDTTINKKPFATSSQQNIYKKEK